MLNAQRPTPHVAFGKGPAKDADGKTRIVLFDLSVRVQCCVSQMAAAISGLPVL